MNAIDRAMSYLNLRPRSCKEIERYLKDKGYEENEIKEAVQQLIEYKYLDDANFARIYIQYGFDKGRGSVRIKQELLSKGVADHVIEDAFYQLEDEGEMPDQFQLALKIGIDVVRDVDVSSLDYKEKKKLEAKVGRRLASRGFCTDIVYRVIKEVCL